MSDAGDGFGALQFRRPPADVTDSVLDQPQKKCTLLWSEAVDVALHQAQDCRPGWPVRHVEYGSVTRRASEPGGRGDAGDSEQVDCAPQDSPVVRQKLRFMSRQELRR